MFEQTKVKLLYWLMKSAEIDPGLLRSNLYGTGDGQWSERNFRRLSNEGYQQCATAYKCVNLVARCLASLDWMVYEGDDERYLKRPKHEITNLIWQPNGNQGKTLFFRSMTSFLELGGNLYIWANLVDNESRIYELWILRNDRVEIIKGNTLHEVQGYLYTPPNGTAKTIPPHQVLHIPLFNPLDDYYGQSPLQAAARSVDTDNESTRWNYNLLKNYGRPPYSLSPPKEARMPLTTPQKNELLNDLKEQHQGSTNAGNPMVFRIPLIMQEYGWKPADMEWLQGRKESKVDIANVYDIPPELVGLQEHKTYNNYKEARAALYQDAVLPLADVVRDEFNRWFHQLNILNLNEWVDYDKDAIQALQEDQIKLSEIAIKLVDSGLVTRNTARVKYLDIEESDEEGASVLTVNANTIPLKMVQSGFVGEDEE